MQRIFLTAMAAAALALCAPGVALAAHHGGAKHGSHHRKHHGRKHGSSARVVDFTASGTVGASTGDSGSPGAPTTSPTPPTGETIGKVLSFENGVLTLELNDGSKVSGKVTEDTRLICTPATPPAGGDDDEGDQAGVSGGAHEDSSSTLQTGTGTSASGQTSVDAGVQVNADHQDGGDQSGSDDVGGGDDQQQSCTTAALTPGTVVREAELILSGSGAIWEKVDLIQ
jgi:hypothetical protein